MITPTDTVTIDGIVTQNQTLTAVTAVLDADGIIGATVSYQWLGDDVAITGATNASYTLAQADVGSAITVTYGYTDNGGTAESVTSTETAAVIDINDNPTGAVTIDGTVTQNEILTANVTAVSDADGINAATVSYQWLGDGAAIDGATNATYTLAQADVGRAITVTYGYTDNGGTVETVTSAATAAVANVNDVPTGAVTIDGTVTQNQTLTAVTAVLDADGINAATVSYQWLGDGAVIDGATNATYTLVQADVGRAITVTSSYTDNGGTAESVTSAATAAVIDVNDNPTGAVTIDGTVTQNQILTANTQAVSDLDGIIGATYTYQWLRDDDVITGATNATYTLAQADVGSAITVTFGYTDNGGTAESVTSAATAAVIDVNDAPTDTVTIDGTVTQNQTLTANVATIDDADGTIGVNYTYQWLRDDAVITGATNATYTLVQADVGSAITVTSSYTDNGGTAESVTSAATAAVIDVNDNPTGAVTIDGTVTQNEILTANVTAVLDADGINATTVTYQWLGDDVAITGATNATYTLVQADVGSAITVTFGYTDNGGTAESVTSGATAAVIDVNDNPTGAVTIDGRNTKADTLTANIQAVGDLDGMIGATYTYQWLGDGAVITGATNATYTLVQADVGSAITVTFGYTDNGGTAESVTSVATLPITNTNQVATGAVTIDGTVTQNQILTANVAAIGDADGIDAATVSYQWLRAGVDITGATNATYTLVQADVGSAITVTFGYTDNGGTAESVTSAATAGSR